VSRFLCTTALEETWPDAQPILFLGEWCKRYSRRDQWSKLDAEILPYHWDDRARLNADYLYLQQLHERLLRELTVNLNELHGVDHSLRYWRILVGPWIGYFVQMVFDRWICLQRAVARYELSTSIVLKGHEEALVPNGMADFPGLFVGDNWNHHICGLILQRFTDVSCSIRPRQPAIKSSSPSILTALRRQLSEALLRVYSRAASALSRENDAVFLSTYLPFLDEFRVQLRLGQLPQYRRSLSPIESAVDGGKRHWTVGGESLSQFEDCARALIPEQIPTIYCEGYHRLKEQVANLPWPQRPKVIWTCNSHVFDDVFKAWAAEKVECGAPLVIGQHGGHFGTGRWSFIEDHDTTVGDMYLSWGWSDRRRRNVRPVGQLKAKHPLNVRHSEQARALLVTCTVPRFSYWMYSATVSRQWLDYFNDQCAFVAGLPRSIRDKLIVRLYPEDFGWDQLARWQDRFPEVYVDQGKSKIDDLIRQSRLYISTYNATTFLESFTMNVPTVIYWNPSHWELRDDADPYFTHLRRVGIFHETPESAARHVTTIWGNVDAWWSSEIVREALDRFKKRFCHLPDDLVGCVVEAVHEATSVVDETATL